MGEGVKRRNRENESSEVGEENFVRSGKEGGSIQEKGIKLAKE